MVNLSLKKSQQAPVYTLAKACQQGPVILEIDPQHDGNTEYVLPVRNRIENVLVQVMPENNGAFSHAGEHLQKTELFARFAAPYYLASLIRMITPDNQPSPF